MCPNEYPITLDWQEDLTEEEERQEEDEEEDNFLVCSDWDADLKEQDTKNLEMEDKKNNDSKTTQPSPKDSSVDTFTPKPSKSYIEQLDNQSSVSPEMEDKKFDTATTLDTKTQKL